ncbi:hypothetical protein [Aquimarina rhabdastrellae]
MKRKIILFFALLIVKFTYAQTVYLQDLPITVNKSKIHMFNRQWWYWDYDVDTLLLVSVDESETWQIIIPNTTLARGSETILFYNAWLEELVYK